MLEVTVKRSEWLRGRMSIERDEHGLTSGGSFLYREEDGTKCCLGFACLAAGLSIAQIKGVCMPAGLVNNTWRDKTPRVPVAKFPESLAKLLMPERNNEGGVRREDSYASSKLAGVNDQVYEYCGPIRDHSKEVRDYTDAEREERIIELGVDVGIKFTFVD